MRPLYAIVLASVLLASCSSGPEPTASVTTTTLCPTGETSEPPTCATTTSLAGEALDFCTVGEEFIRNYEDHDYGRHPDPSELRAFMERGNVVTDALGAQAPPEVELSIKAVAAAFDKRRNVYSNHDFAIQTVTPDENKVLAAVEVDVEDSEQRTHQYIVTRCNITL